MIDIHDPAHKFMFMLLERIEKLEEQVDDIIKDNEMCRKALKREKLESLYNCKFDDNKSNTCFCAVIEHKNEGKEIACHVLQDFCKSLESDKITRYSYEVTRYISLTSVKAYEVIELDVYYNTIPTIQEKVDLVIVFDIALQQRLGEGSQIQRNVILSSQAYDIVEEFYKVSFEIGK